MTRVYVNGPRQLPRRFKHHWGKAGRRYREHFQALEAALGPFNTELQRQAAADAAAQHVTKLQAVEAWEQAVYAREHGQGRRPSVTECGRLAKRQALESQSYVMAYNRLVDLLAATKTGTPSVAFAGRT